MNTKKPCAECGGGGRVVRNQDGHRFVTCPLCSQGCKRRLAEGQWWNFCGETDMGQTAPALCTECGGEFKLAE